MPIGPTSIWKTNIAIDLIGCLSTGHTAGKIWTILETVPGETYEVRFPYGINEDDWTYTRGDHKTLPYVRRGIVSWDGTDMATFEGNTELFNLWFSAGLRKFQCSGHLADQTQTSSSVATTHTKADGGFGRHSNNFTEGPAKE